jgi:hypothetical protein
MGARRDASEDEIAPTLADSQPALDGARRLLSKIGPYEIVPSGEM